MNVIFVRFVLKWHALSLIESESTEFEFGDETVVIMRNGGLTWRTTIAENRLVSMYMRTPWFGNALSVSVGLGWNLF